MLHHSIFEPDPDRSSEWLACLWQGPAPRSLVIRHWLYLQDDPRRMAMVWEGDAEAEAFVERAFGGFGKLETRIVADNTPGMRFAIDRDLDGFEKWAAAFNVFSTDELARQLDLRRRGRDAPDQAAAAAEGRGWAAET